MIMAFRRAAVVLAVILGGVFLSLAVHVIQERRRKEKNTGAKEKKAEKAEKSGQSVKDADKGEESLQQENDGSSDDSLDDTFVKIRLQPAGSTEDREIPRAPPPSRNLSRSDLPKGDSLEEETSSLQPTTPPPSRSMSSSELSSSVFTINEESGPYLVPPDKAYGRQHSSGGQPITDEVAAAMSLSLGTQGYGDLEDTPSFCVISGDRDSSNTKSTTSISLPQTFAFMSPDNENPPDLTSLQSSNYSSDFSIVGDSSHQGTSLQQYQPEKEQIQATFQTLASGDFSSFTLKDAQVLTYLLGSSNWNQEAVLVYVANASAFTQNQNLLREAGCLTRITALLRAHEMAMRVSQQVTYPTLVNKVISAVNNLSANEQNQTQLQECIPVLINFATASNTPESVQLSSLQALTNLSTSPDNHEPYTKVIQQLYEALDQGSIGIKQQALKVLVNLSTNPDMVPHLLAAKAPGCLLDLLAPTADEGLVLRWVTVLANVMIQVRERKITAEVLPTDYKAASPETMFTALYGVANIVKLRSKVFVLSKHQHEDISQHAARVYACLA